VAPYLTLMTEEAPQRWIKAGVFEAMVHDLRTLLRLALIVHSS